jgi:hypothetical protein
MGDQPGCMASSNFALQNCDQPGCMAAGPGKNIPLSMKRE